MPRVIALDNFNRSISLNGSVSLTLSCILLECSATRKGTMIQTTAFFKNGYVSFDNQVVYDDSDSAIGSGYSWVISSAALLESYALNPANLGIDALQSERTSMLGPLPVVEGVHPLFVSFLGNTTITVTSSVWNVLSRMSGLARHRSAMCSFALWNTDEGTNMTNYSVEAQTVLGGNLNSRICVVPEAPPLLVWNVSVVLTDGRISSNNGSINNGIVGSDGPTASAVYRS
jgi:hypothetical protein